MTDTKTHEPDSTNKPDIVVTEAMIEVGAKIIRYSGLEDFPISWAVARALSREVLEAALKS